MPAQPSEYSSIGRTMRPLFFILSILAGRVANPSRENVPDSRPDQVEAHFVLEAAGSPGFRPVLFARGGTDKGRDLAQPTVVEGELRRSIPSARSLLLLQDPVQHPAAAYMGTR